MNWKLLAVQFVINAALLYGLAALCGRSVRIGGVVAALSVAVVIAPINVFIGYIDQWLGIPLHPAYMFLSAVVANGVMLYLLSYIIPKVRVENLGIALVFAAIMGVVSLFLHFFLADHIAVLLR